MKTTVKTGMALVIGLMLVTSIGCATGSKPGPSGFLGEWAKNLQPGPEDGAKERWLKPGVNFAKYNRIMLDSVIFYLAEDSEDKRIDASEMKELADECNHELVVFLQGTYPIVAAPGPDVVRIRFAITDIKQSRPVLSGVTSVLPVGLGISLVKEGVTGSWTGAGMTVAELMALDSMTNEVIAVARDERTAGFGDRFAKWGSTKEAFLYWAQRLKTFLDSAHSISK